MPLLLLFIVLPLTEFYLLMAVGAEIGLGSTILLCIATGLAGASLARSQGRAVLMKVQGELGAGRLPPRVMMEGVLIFASGLVLLTPGFITDVLGLLCLLPPTRKLIEDVLQRSLERAQREGRLNVSGRGPGGGTVFFGMSGQRRPGAGFGAGPGPGAGAGAGPGAMPDPSSGDAPLPGPMPRGGLGGGVKEAKVVRERTADEDQQAGA